jgi:hypothetical protein
MSLALGIGEAPARMVERLAQRLAMGAWMRSRGGRGLLLLLSSAVLVVLVVVAPVVAVVGVLLGLDPFLGL